MGLKSDLRQLERRHEKLGESVAELVAEREHVEQTARHKSKREPKRTERQEKIDRELVKLRKEARELTKKIRKRRRRRSRVTRKIKRTARRLRNRVRPKIIDLHLSFGGMASQGRIVRVIGHHTAGPTDDDDGEAIRLCRQYHAAHRAKGWAGEGYGLNFTRDGSIILLRPLGYVGAHTLGYNTGSLGIMCHGTTGDHPTKAQKRALRWWAKNGHKRGPGSHRAPVKPSSVGWFGHSHFNSTACPGTHARLYESKGKNR